MPDKPAPTDNWDTHRIQIKLRDINQLFNTMDPSPFLEKDLDADAEEFIVGWAREFPARDTLVLEIHLNCSDPAPQQSDGMIQQAVQHYFAYRADIGRLEFRRLLRDGRLSLVIGLIFLSVCLTLAHFMGGNNPDAVQNVAQQGLTIAGWVAMWRPLEIYLYDWWPVWRRWKIFQKMSGMKVEIIRHAV